MNEDYNSYFKKVFQVAEITVLQNPERFISVLNDVSKGKIKDQNVVCWLLKKEILPQFNVRDIKTEEGIDDSVQIAVESICSKYPYQKEWILDICQSLANAIKEKQGIPASPSSSHGPAGSVKEPENDDGKPPFAAGNTVKPVINKSKIFAITGALVIIAVIVLLVVRFGGSVPTSVEKPVKNTEVENQNHEAVLNAADLLGMSMKEIVKLLGDDYYEYSYEGGFSIGYDQYELGILFGSWQDMYAATDYTELTAIAVDLGSNDMMAVDGKKGVLRYDEVLDLYPEANDVDTISYEDKIDDDYETVLEFVHGKYKLRFTWSDTEGYPDINNEDCYITIELDK